MTLRNPETPFSQDDDEISENEVDPLNPTLLPRPSSASAASSRQALYKTPALDFHEITHPVFTDFGPQSLGNYLRREIEKLRSSATPCSTSVKGKERAQPQRVSPHKRSGVRAFSHGGSEPLQNERREPDSDLLGLMPTSSYQPDKEATTSMSTARPKATETVETSTQHHTPDHEPQVTAAPPADISNTSEADNTPSSPTARRSTRLAEKGLSFQAPIAQPSTSSRTSNPFRSLQNLAVGYIGSLTNATPSLLSVTASRRSNFEAHTKSEREAARAAAAASESSSTASSSPPRPLNGKSRTSNTQGDPNNAPTTTHSLDEVLLNQLPKDSQSESLPAGPALENRLQDSKTMASAMRLTQPASDTSVSPIERAASCCIPIPFDYFQVVPESIPKSFTKDYLVASKKQPRTQTPAPDEAANTRGLASLSAGVPPDPKLKDRTVRPAPEDFPRVLPPVNLPSDMPRDTRGRSGPCKWSMSKQSHARNLEDFNTDLWMGITQFLSSRDVHSLRLVSRELAEILSSIQFRNVVVNFDKFFFDASDSKWDARTGHLPPDSLFKKYGDNFNQFGIAFEYNIVGLANAKPKVIEKEQEAWFGKFTWPTEHYPRYPVLQAIEDSVDNNRPLLKEAFKHVSKPSELGLCVDSGHGWLEGPDISDLALLSRRMSRGSKVFGKTFSGQDSMHDFARNEYFKWAQRNTINESIKHVVRSRSPGKASATRDIRFLDAMAVRDYESFQVSSEQHDFDPASHVGGAPGTTPHQALPLPHQHLNWAHANILAAHNPVPRQHRPSGSRQASTRKQLPQWPLIFNGHNIAAEMGGHCSFIQNKTAHPMSMPLRPGALTEAQAQWLMETVWAQRAFLSAYTTAIITNKQNFRMVHTLRISKLSSGLLPSLAQREFWSSLSGLKRLQLLVSPDWRQEHITGDRYHQTSMPTPPHKAAQRFTEFLKLYVIPVESLHSLSVGYVGGGEHAVGIHARNQHVLYAPIIDNPTAWLRNEDEKRLQGLTKFDHIRDLTFENCWFSPKMLQEFMKQSRDTSLHSLTLDSVSLLTNHDPSLEQPLTTGGNNLRCQLESGEWLREQVPTSAAWIKVLDDITPGPTLLERKYAAGLIDEVAHPMPTRAFRGHIQKITLKSCGYVKITLPKGIKHTTLNQNSAVVHLASPTDSGIRARRERFTRWHNSGTPDSVDLSLTSPARRADSEDSPNLKRVMMSTMSPDGEHYPWLGTLTQCIHPIEKRILEMAWGMEFGWPNNLERWAAVEDGFFEGGTGRFSGTIDKAGEL